MKPTYKTLMAAAIFLALHGTARAEVAIVTHPGNAESQLNIEEVRDIYLGKSTTFPKGGKAMAVDQKDGTAAKDEFLAKVLKKDPGQYRSNWAKLIFSGKAVPPSVMSNDADVRSWIARNPEGLGYIDKGAVDGSVKVLLSVP